MADSSNPDKTAMPVVAKSLTHTHAWTITTKKVPLHNYVSERGKIVKDLISGVDIVQQFVCKCGKTSTTRILERKAA